MHSRASANKIGNTTWNRKTENSIMWENFANYHFMHICHDQSWNKKKDSKITFILNGDYRQMKRDHSDMTRQATSGHHFFSTICVDWAQPGAAMSEEWQTEHIFHCPHLWAKVSCPILKWHEQTAASDLRSSNNASFQFLNVTSQLFNRLYSSIECWMHSQ